ncbi:hypothetical protein GMI69_07645 [Eggerthellaceae bacterium zg-887]|nr:hypothetical protein [Xiamenia xianingshaonis]
MTRKCVGVSIVGYLKDADCITHSGVFHADEVLGTVILEKAFGDLAVARVAEVPADLADDVIVYDIGRGKYDHHQPGGNGQRENGVAYASAGLLWKAFGNKVVLSNILRKFKQPPYALRYDHSSSSVTSRYLLEPHSLSATYFKRALTSMRADLPSGKVPTTRARLLISRLSRSMALLVRIRLQCPMGKRA